MFKNSCRLPLAWRDVVEIMLEMMVATLNASRKLHPSSEHRSLAAIGYVIEQVRTTNSLPACAAHKSMAQQWCLRSLNHALSDYLVQLLRLKRLLSSQDVQLAHANHVMCPLLIILG